MTDWTTLVYGLIVRPGEAMTRASRSFSWRAGLVVLLVATVSWHFASAMLFHNILPSFAVGFVFLLPVRAVLVIAVWVVAAALVHAVARGMKGYGTVGSLLLVLGLAALPLALLAPLSLLTEPLGLGGKLLFILCAAVLALWSVVLAVVGVRRAYYLSGAGAAVAVLAPCAVLPLIVLGASVLYGMSWLYLHALRAAAGMLSFISVL